MTSVVFGASGNVGRHVAEGLNSVGAQVRWVGRDPNSARFPAGADIVAADLECPETLPAALDGAERVFLYAKPEGIDGFVAAAEAAGVRHVVLLSSGAVTLPDPMDNPVARMHLLVENALASSRMEWTFLRPGMFASNALWWWQRSIREEGAVRLPYPEARTAPVHERDLAALAITALTEPGHHGQAYEVLGPESPTLREQVQHIGSALDREIAIEVVSVDEARADLRKTVPPFAVEAILAGWQAGLTGPHEVSTIVEEVTGRPGRTFAEWARDHASDFR
ncbi:NAD(P)H-binding protein [Nocardia sp. NPDC050406]|uniref:NAD(P)H-binding protein n=1 Tax=Nocardia sp. NPDC050406 TaxID=3364318 RepID=UPI00378A6F7D